MKIRRFFAKDMRTGLAEISKELGSDAAILSTNSVNGGIEIVAATDYEQSLLDSRHSSSGQPKATRTKNASRRNSTGSSFSDGHKTARNSHQEHPGESVISDVDFESTLNGLKKQQTHKKPDEIKRTSSNTASSSVASSAQFTDNPSIQATSVNDTFAEVVTENKEPSPSNSIYNTGSTAEKTLNKDFSWGVDPVISGVKDELELIRGLLQSQLAELSWKHKIGSDPVSTELLKRLVALGLPVSLSESYTLKKQSAELKQAWYQVAAALAHDINISTIDPVQQGGCYALVGPTGVGKTTTIAKMAAMAALKYGADSVAMISTDSYRIAAHEQLTVYGQIMGVQVISVADANALSRTLQQLSDKRLILIDTAGIGQRDKRLAEQVACLTRSGENIQNLLVLSATAQLASIKESVQRFGELKLDGAILTKLDEATSLGPALTTLIRTGMAVSFVTNGQNVPDDIHPARAHDLITEAINLANSYPQESEDEWQIAQSMKAVS